MSEPTPSHPPVTADDLRRYDWQARLAKHAGKDCATYCEVFIAGAEECDASNDALGGRVYSLLNAVASFHPNYDAKGNPYGPRLTMADGRRSRMAEDLTDDELQALRGILEEIENPEYRARVGDVVWESARDYKAAQIAVWAFLESAEQHNKGDDLWPAFTERLERAAQISARLGFGKPLHQQVLGVVKDAIRKSESDLKTGLRCQKLMRIALAHDVPETEHYAALSERWAMDLASIGEHTFSYKYWKLAARWHKKGKEELAAQRCLLEAAEGIVTSTEERLQNGEFNLSNAASLMGKALEELNQARASSGRRTEVHRRLLELQKQALEKMRPMEVDLGSLDAQMDVQRMQSAAAEHVRGHSFEDAVARLTRVTRFTDVEALRKSMLQQSEELIWDKLVDTEILDYSGKVSAVIPASISGDTEAQESFRMRMVHRAREIDWPIQVRLVIEPARHALLEEHPVRLHDLEFLVVGNPFIPPDHELMYLRGLQAGFLGDWLVATHLLIPQVEASLRYVFQRKGIVTSTVDSDGLQQERDINQLLWLPEMKKIFGEDATFDLQGLLIDRCGHNLRNECSHGLMPAWAFYQPADVYLWWMLLRLCWTGYTMAQAKQDGKE